MSFENVTKVDVLYDKKAYGNLIDPYEWNNNFEVIENVSNSNADKINKNFESLTNGTTLLPTPDYFGGGSVPSTINAQLELIVNRLKDTYTISEIDAADASMKQNTVKSIEFNEDTGVFTITTADGKVNTIDTNIEKIPVSVSLVNEGEKVYLVLTLDDGTSTKADVTSLLNVYTFIDSDTIEFSDNGSRISSNIKDGSVTPTKLSTEVLGSLEGFSNSASASAQSASASAANAKQSSDSASASATSASTSATNANAYANSANESKVASENIKKSVDTTSQTILSKVDIAIQSADQASESASIASQKATEAQTSVNSIGNSVTVATTKASEAEVSANEAAASSAEATNQVNLAKAEVTKATNQVNLAKAEATKATEQANISEDFSLTSKSYAVGGTGTRTGEDTDNAKYYSEQAKQAAGGDFVTNADFNAHTSNTNNPHGVTCELIGASKVSHNHTKDNITDFPTSLPASDVSEWAKQPNKPTYTAVEVGARPNTWMPTASDVGALPVDTPIHNSPAGGVTGQVLTKKSDTDYDAEWQDVASGGVGKAGTGANSEIFNNYTYTTASGDYSHAEGSGTTASGSCSHAEGQGSAANGVYSHAEGCDTATSGHASHAEGWKTTASGQCSHAEGRKTTASGSCSHAEGNNTKVEGDYSHAECSYTSASGSCSHAEGYKTTASGYISHVEGYNTTASGGQSHAEGSNISTNGNSLPDIVVNVGTEAEPNNITVSGSRAEGCSSHAEGVQTLAYGYSSHAEGCSTIASGSCSHAEGNGTTASGDNSHAQGKYNVEDTENKYAFIIGNGTADNARSNAFAIRWDGTFDIKSPNGTLFNISVNDSGVLTATQV